MTADQTKRRFSRFLPEKKPRYKPPLFLRWTFGTQQGRLLKQSPCDSLPRVSSLIQRRTYCLSPNLMHASAPLQWILISSWISNASPQSQRGYLMPVLKVVLLVLQRYCCVEGVDTRNFLLRKAARLETAILDSIRGFLRMRMGALVSEKWC